MKNYTLGIYEKALPANLTWREKLEFAKKVGYDFLEISIDETNEKLQRLDSDDKYELLKLSKEILPIETMCLSGHRKYPLGSHDENIRNKSLEIMKKAIDLASFLGIRIIQLAGYDVYYENGDNETKKYFEENLQKCVNMAAKKGILMGFETMETDFMNTVSKSMEYVNKINSKYLGVYPDLGNITNATKDVVSDLNSGKGSLIAMHLKETVPGKFREIPFGTGHVNFEEGIKTAWNLGVRRYVTEFWDVGKENWKDDVYDAFNRMSTILDKQN